MSKQTQASGFTTYRRLLRYALPYRWAFVVSFIGFAIFAATQAAFAGLMELLLNALDNLPIPAYLQKWWVFSDTLPPWQILLPLLAVSIFMIRGIGSFLGTFFIEKVAQGLIHDLRVDLFNKITVLKSSDLDAENSGHTVSKITFNTQQVTAAATNAVKVLIREGLTVIGLLSYLIWQDWQLTLTFLVVGPILAVIVSVVSKMFRRYSTRIQESAGDITHVTTEAVQGFRIVRAFGGIPRERKRFNEASANNAAQNLKLAFSRAISTPVMQVIVAMAIGGVIFLILSPETAGNSSAASLMAYMTAVSLLPKPIRQLSEVNADLQKGIAAGDSIFSVLDQEEETHTDQPEALNLSGSIQVKDLSFSYNNTETVLSDINFTVQPGKVLALVGRSGSGKSTITNLLLRFYEGWQGKIEIDGKSITDFSLDALRSQIALVNQNVVLFNDTIANNIAYGELENHSRDAIIAAAKKANAWDFIQEQSEGLDTNIGEGGLMLSGGQRQRIAIARALLKDAPILILDEATSALDNESEKLIQDALSHAMENRTTIVVAHRLSTIIDADEILVMDAGKVIEQGTHQSLLDQDGYYSQLVKSSEA
ncbi:lipid A export permease/ATP-binding protein MsbA [Umboniibacter marinipuniceus]|uniref:Subfamily B ATP-binding cassette protein MsbA n=1 Tax=Umboniibacter marinipuniceus TaxID=569599 RepID=A0A3M0AC62_9GAMM|nr:lipid A export permease/ATP-binding protein MsbA [Umboniibacter marinipuniceus]RMA80035.1 subfamily B ATP-binding cassette protein MsbA [Umboniibacter marinipuniceus]